VLPMCPERSVTYVSGRSMGSIPDRQVTVHTGDMCDAVGVS
jgi:hypothetical protein